MAKPAGLQAGDALPPLDKGILTTSRIARWCAAQENWDRIHYDADYATKVAGLPGPVINGALKQHILCQLVEAAFGTAAWLWRLEFRFTGLDLVGQGLRADGRVRDIHQWRGLDRIELDVSITNTSTGETTTAGQATLLRSGDGQPMLDARHLADEALDAPSPGGADVPAVPEPFAGRIGRVLEQIDSFNVVEPGRLRLFAEAVGDVAPLHFDADLSAASPFGGTVAMPLFPIHALSRRPGERDLSVDPRAFGREGVCEIGRDSARLFGLGPMGFLNGGNRTQIHSLARVGDRVSARSRLVGAKLRSGKKGGTMLILETRNDYWTDRQIPLLTEQQTTICRDIPPSS